MTFTASNGVTVTKKGRFSLAVERFGTDRLLNINAERADALREFFQQEKDAELGRWRWSENPDYVVYLDNGAAVVVDESDPRRGNDRIPRRYCEDPHGSLGWGEDAARAYFQVHPERKSLPEVDGIYAVSPDVHPYERLIQRRDGEWVHLYRSDRPEGMGDITAEYVAQVAVNEGRLTRLVAEDAS